jgi:transcriptional regulator with XRE-family HTH domain
VDIAARFGKNIARCRKRAGLSQEELSIRASLHRTEVSQLERGLRLARIDTLVKLAGALQVPTDALVEGIDWRPGSATLGQFSVATKVGEDAD